MEIRSRASALTGALLLVLGCNKSLPTEAVLPPTPTPTTSLTGTWTGTIATGSNPVAVTAHVSQTDLSIRIDFQVAGATGTSRFTGNIGGSSLDGQFCRGLCGCSASAGTVTPSRIHLRTVAGNVLLDCFGNTIELSR